MTLTILNVAFPLAPVGVDSIGGAEQVLLAIDQSLARQGHRSIVVARPESKVAGTLIPTIPVGGTISDATWRAAHEATRKAIACALDHFQVDLVHMHGIDFADYLPSRDVPVLATLHLPLSWYSQRALRNPRPRTYVHCVSRSQRESCPANAHFLPEIENGVPVDFFAQGANIRKLDYVVSLGRICAEKSFDVALRAAKRAGISMLLAGSVYPFEEHERYFADKIAPELDSRRRYVGPVSLRSKRRLLSGARCLIVPSAVPETSSLVAMEALACGTPVVGFARGALPDIIGRGRIGLVVGHESEIPDAIKACRSIDPAECRKVAAAFFSVDRMVEQYIAAYERILDESKQLSQVA